VPTTPQPGDLIVYRTDGWPARLIQVGNLLQRLLRRQGPGNWRWNHVGIYIGAGMTIEAQPGGVCITPLSDYPVGTYIVLHRDLTEAQKTQIISYANGALGKSYGWLAIVGLILVGLGIRPKILDTYAADEDEPVCSQLGAYAYAYAGSPLSDQAPWTMTPGNIADVYYQENK
jgi:hypothetical protein